MGACFGIISGSPIEDSTYMTLTDTPYIDDFDMPLYIPNITDDLLDNTDKFDIYDESSEPSEPN
ncbi:MAG: hypothetical protein Faunusvirus7_4 [Faunusvirus sp.]|jgi:hypothetical protein|uniref:Uncharacterized protein n=1 Tax=Faunusvirus sp. TaxID=2487766 RepID=A0A3G4ZWI4_9VIRU|nr:MAG: hypothetical protein Faunusvirus7_4 [Faunusvirus sp.]